MLSARAPALSGSSHTCGLPLGCTSPHSRESEAGSSSVCSPCAATTRPGCPLWMRALPEPSTTFCAHSSSWRPTSTKTSAPRARCISVGRGSTKCGSWRGSASAWTSTRSPPTACAMLASTPVVATTSSLRFASSCPSALAAIIDAAHSSASGRAGIRFDMEGLLAVDPVGLDGVGAEDEVQLEEGRVAAVLVLDVAGRVPEPQAEAQELGGVVGQVRGIRMGHQAGVRELLGLVVAHAQVGAAAELVLRPAEEPQRVV